MIDEAFEIAKVNPIKTLPKMAAILTHKGKIKAVGFNKMKSHPMQHKYGRNSKSNFLHAEIDCIKNALRNYTPKEISKFSIYIARSRKDGKKALAKPCTGCQNALKDYGITKVYWTED